MKQYVYYSPELDKIHVMFLEYDEFYYQETTRIAPFYTTYIYFRIGEL